MPADVPLAELDEKSRLLPGGENGRIDVAGFLAVLREMGYDGPVTVEALAGRVSEPPPRRGHQADQRGAGQGLAGGGAVRPTAQPAMAAAATSG